MTIKLPSHELTIRQALEEVEKKVDELYYSSEKDYDALDIQFALEQYLSHIRVF